ncbi:MULTISPECIES: hypothetical protein [unclassified Sphingomonas]|uniref:hypothetical protein n=1 Tax=unclassified Sphingomonas TaxID=196159 RepID=UPI0006F803D1|nr:MULTISPECIES: hypothetical protein [unclassified Sphingomonas]KQX19074.1 hypothetical protein ASD17_10920 [Sphingomonas sp. Root1294]KQY65275.1 hypothetical protein ASD39_14115 [Sphingomonas sp. Root50]KRB95430.1 hypothetical protein ASE22_05940 [Sphingomonas sp. Root720]
MFLKMALAAAIATGVTSVVQATDLPPHAMPERIAALAAQPHPRQMAGPVHIRFRQPGDVVVALDSGDPAVRREAAFHPRADRGQFD